jgi:hypothetical protein
MRGSFFLKKFLTQSSKCAAAFAASNPHNSESGPLNEEKHLIERRPHMKPRKVKQILFSEIKRIASTPERYSLHPGTDFTRKRKLPMERLLSGIIGLGGGSLSSEVLDLFHCAADAPSSSAFVQQRNKLRPEAMEDLFRAFAQRLSTQYPEDMRIFAVDGTDLHIFTNPEDVGSYYSGANGQKPYNLLHVNAFYDLLNGIYVDAVVQKRNEENEHLALCTMTDRSSVKKALVIADRGFESYNDMAHIQEKGWFFLIRIKDGNHGIKSNLVLPNTPSFDMEVELNLTRKQSNETKRLCKEKNRYRYLATSTVFDYLPKKSRYLEEAVFYKLRFRIIRFPLSENEFETVLTNLDKELFPPDALKQLYAMRWGIETSFRSLKYTLGMIRMHTKKVMGCLQEIFAHLIMYDFAKMITSNVAIRTKERKHALKANFSVAVHVCRRFYLGDISPPDLEAIIERNLIPIRPDRHVPRNLSGARHFQGFHYRIS